MSDERRVEQHNLRGHALLSGGDVDGAMAAFLDALAEDPSDVPAMLSRLEVLALYREDHPAAVAAGRVMRARGIGGVAMASAFAYSLCALGAHAEALEVIYEGLRTDPETEPLWYNAACAHAKLRRWDATALALETATRLSADNGPLARADADFAEVAQEPWFLEATSPSSPSAGITVRIAHAEADRARALRLAKALGRRGHAVSQTTIAFPTGDASGRLALTLLDDDRDRLLVFDDGSEGARATERELAAARERIDAAPPVALIVPSWLPTEHLPSFHSPGDTWGRGALGMLAFFLGPMASEPPG